MKDAHHNEINAGDRIMITRIDRPLRAVVEHATEESIAVLAFMCEKDIGYHPKQGWPRRFPWKEAEDMLLHQLRWTFRTDIGLGPNGFCTRVLKMHWEFLPQEAKFYGTSDPATLIKPKTPIKGGKKIKSFPVGTNKWMAENLDVQSFRNGDPIPLVPGLKEWKKAAKDKQPACCYYNNDQNEFGTRGLLYNTFAVTDPRGLAPEGWHVATETEYRELIALYGGPNKAGKLLRHQKGWYDGPFMYMSDFKGLPNGLRNASGKFEGEGYYGQWLADSGNGQFSMMIMRGEDIDALVFPVSDKGTGFSVRCVKDGK